MVTCMFFYVTEHNDRGLLSRRPENDRHQEKMRGQRGRLPDHALGYVDSTKVINSFRRKRKSVFRDVCIKANLELMYLIKAK